MRAGCSPTDLWGAVDALIAVAYRHGVDGYLDILFDRLIADAGGILAVDIAFWAVIGFLASLCFALGVVWLLGNLTRPVTEEWSGTWRAVMYLFFIMFPTLGAAAGAGEGTLRGVERAVRTSEIGQQLLPQLADAGVGLYAIVYTMEPGEMDSASDMFSFSNVSEIRSYTEGRKALDAERLQRQVTTFRRRGLPTLMEHRETAEEMVDFFGEDYRLAQRTMRELFDHAERASNDPAVEGPLGVMFGDLGAVAALDGDPATITKAELTSHLTDNVVIPTILRPVKAVVRPGQLIIAGLALLLFGFTVAVRTANQTE